MNTSNQQFERKLVLPLLDIFLYLRNSNKLIVLLFWKFVLHSYLCDDFRDFRWVLRCEESSLAWNMVVVLLDVWCLYGDGISVRHSWLEVTEYCSWCTRCSLHLRLVVRGLGVYGTQTTHCLITVRLQTQFLMEFRIPFTLCPFWVFKCFFVNYLLFLFVYCPIKLLKKQFKRDAIDK